MLMKTKLPTATFPALPSYLRRLQICFVLLSILIIAPNHAYAKSSSASGAGKSSSVISKNPPKKLRFGLLAGVGSYTGELGVNINEKFPIPGIGSNVNFYMDTNLTEFTRYSAGVSLDYYLNDRIDLRGELRYAYSDGWLRQTVTMSAGVFLATDWIHYDYSNHYLSIPLSAKFYFFKKRRFFLDAGLSADILLKSNYRMSSAEDSAFVTDSEHDTYRKFVASVFGGIGYWFFGVRFQLPFTSYFNDKEFNKNLDAAAEMAGNQIPINSVNTRGMRYELYLFFKF